MNEILKQIVRKSCFKIGIFILMILLITILAGLLLYFLEGTNGGFNTILVSTYWASEALLTVGYGDFVPQTGYRRNIALLLRVMGYSIFYLPVIIFVYEIVNTFLDLFAGAGNDNP